MKKSLMIFLYLLASSILYGQIKVDVSTDKTEYLFRDSIKISVTARNTSEQSIDLNWNTSCQAGYEIINWFKLTVDTSCTDGLTSLTLEPNQSYTWSFTYPGYLTAGSYQILGEVYGYGISDTAEIVIIEKDFSYYSAAVKNPNNQPISNVTVISDGAAQVVTNTDGKFTLKYSSSIFPEGYSTAYPVISYYHPDYDYYSDTISISKGDSIKGPDVILYGLISATGKIKFENNEPVQNCYVYFFNSTNYYLAVSDINGNYLMQCIPGLYYIGALLEYRYGDTWTYRTKYYDDKTDLADAELIEVNSQTNDINFTLPDLSLGTISGKVIDKETQLPLSNAWISVQSAEPSDSVFSGTDENGNYTIEVFEGSYHVSVYENGYYKQFYKDAYNTFDATPVTVNKDTLNITGIDFSLIKPESGSNTISGFIRDKNTNSELAGVEVYAIPVNGGDWIESTTGYDGAYYLRDIKDGDYILLFYKENCISRFYTNYYETCGEWEDAFIFRLDGGEHISDLFTYLEPMSPIGGQILGSIYNNSSSSISGTLISAVDSAGNTVSSSISVFNGKYLIPSLKNGNYTLKASKIGYQTSQYSEKVNIDLNSKPVVDGINIYINLTDVNEAEKIIPEFYKLSQNYPNPFNPSTIINYEIPSSGLVTLKIYDVLGREVKTLVSEVKNPGRYNVKFDGSNLSSGLYFYRITTNNFTETKKMLMLK
ncbi:MAG TPA: carboxypeptidase regulatory-like domain-containing protein [Ignavibacteriaceae bacterium]|nr:carboxypeptidase regulatory-like domain-containing protein [Ignavibacteriaceae bacterium]